PSESGTPASGAAQMLAVSLLQQSHDLGQQLTLPVRLNLLPRQAEMISQWRSDLGREWVNELFTLSSELRGDQRSMVQESAMRMSVRLDPDRALELLHSMPMEEPEGRWATSLPKLELANRAFQALATRDGVRALPLLEQEADLMGKEGHYPYAALGYGAM